MRIDLLWPPKGRCSTGICKRVLGNDFPDSGQVAILIVVIIRGNQQQAWSGIVAVFEPAPEVPNKIVVSAIKWIYQRHRAKKFAEFSRNSIEFRFLPHFLAPLFLASNDFTGFSGSAILPMEFVGLRLSPQTKGQKKTTPKTTSIIMQSIQVQRNCGGGESGEDWSSGVNDGQLGR